MIRAACPDDTAWITELWNRVIADTLITFTTVAKAQDGVRALIDTGAVLVMPDQAGFACYGPFRSGPGYAATVEHTIYLAPQAQGQGLGGPLLRQLMEHAQRAGHHVSVAAISGANPGAVRFHAKHGFTEVGRLPQVGQKAGHWLDLILMQKLLNTQDIPGNHG